MISFSYKMGLDGRRQLVLLFSLLPYLKNQPASRVVANTVWRPAFFLVGSSHR